MNHNYSCIIIDDEPIAVELLIDSLSIVNKNIRVVNTYTSWPEALEGIRSADCDIIFLDISIDDKNGMDLLRSVPDIRSEIIFVTAHSSYALNAFKFPTTGYILKPINEIDLATTIDRAISRIDYRRLAGKNKPAIQSSKIGIPDQKSITYVALHDILYLEAVNTSTRVVTREGEITSSYHMRRFRELLPEDMFYQVHRSFIVNLDCVRKYEHTGTITLDNQQELPVSRSARSQFLALFARVKGT